MPILEDTLLPLQLSPLEGAGIETAQYDAGFLRRVLTKPETRKIAVKRCHVLTENEDSFHNTSHEYVFPYPNAHP